MNGPVQPVSGVVPGATKCQECGATTRLGRETCVSCLLKEGLEAEGEASAEAFESVLVEAHVRDLEWRLGNYEILEEIGRGGMGVIYRARQRHSRRVVALKRVLTYHADSHETFERFRREAEAAASLDHPNILPIYEVSESENGLPFFSMKLATGGSLRAAASALRSDPRACVQLMAKVACAIEYAHAQGILHRDLQPGNILLDHRGEPMVSDFGLAKWLQDESDLTRTLTSFGTPGYIAPEQAEGAAADLTPAADVYSLGAMLFNLFAGRPPFVGANALSVIRQAAASPAPKLRALAPSIDRDLQTICARCLERDPKARYQTAGAFAEDLEHWLEGRPILARPVRPPARVWRWSRRNPLLAGAAAGCILFAFAVAGLLRERFVARSKASAPEKSIAVLPFQNLSKEAENAFFAEGVQDEIRYNLAKIADLKVISRTSANNYAAGQPRNSRQIGQELGVAHLLEGSVHRAGNHLRINAQLIDTGTDLHLWAQTYNRDVADLFAIQSELAQTIADQLQAKISAREKVEMAQPPTTDSIASDLYRQALALDRQLPHGQNVLKAVSLLEQAVARDPHFYLAYCTLARTHLAYDQTASRLKMANTAIQKAAQLQPEAGEVHLARALYDREVRDYDHARAELELARRALPNDPAVYFEVGFIDRRQGRWTEAVRNFERAIELDPRNVEFLDTAASTYSAMRRYPEATEYFRRALAVSPHDYSVRLGGADQPFHERADIRPMRSELGAILAEDPGAAPKIADALLGCALLERDPAAANGALAAIPPEGAGGLPNAPCPREWWVGRVARTFNRREDARVAFEATRASFEKLLREQPENVSAWSLLGQADAALGRKEEAIKAGLRACELLPLSKEPISGLRPLLCLAIIYASVGEKDLALQQLATSAGQIMGVSYGQLKLDPDWDPLRGDSRFEEIVASLAPKD